jgi:hypothetical protein
VRQGSSTPDRSARCGDDTASCHWLSEAWALLRRDLEAIARGHRRVVVPTVSAGAGPGRVGAEPWPRPRSG